MLLGGLILLASLVALLRTLPAPRPELVQLETTQPAPPQSENVELILYGPGPEGTAVEHPVFVDLALPEDAASRFAKVSAELRAQTLSTLWPAALPAPTAFALATANGAQTVAVLDFAVTEPVALDVETERLLLQSVEATLLRNGADRVQILVNHEESGNFLGHVALASVLGE